MLTCMLHIQALLTGTGQASHKLHTYFMATDFLLEYAFLSNKWNTYVN